MNVALVELRNAARGLVARPAFSALIVGVLGVGLACVIFMLAMINGFLIRPLPFAQPERLLQAVVRDAGTRTGEYPLDSREIATLREALRSSAKLAAAARSTVNLSDLDRPERYEGAFVSGNLFGVLGIAPLLGRDFAVSDEQPGAPVVAMLSYELWQSRYGGDSDIVGRVLRIDAKPATVIGVMPKDFSYPRRERVWLPAEFSPSSKADGRSYRVVLRPHAETGIPVISNAFERWFAQASKADSERFRGLAPYVEALAPMGVDSTTRRMLGLTLVSVVMVLLVACANAANLMLTRTLGRRHELTVRVAMGASPKRMALLLLSESLLLSGAATLLALILASVALGWQESVLHDAEWGPPLWLHIGIDATVLLMAAGAALLTALLAGIWPALRAARTIESRLREGSPGLGGGAFARTSRFLVIGEIALSCALLIGVGTMVRGLAAIGNADLGIDTTHLLTARVVLPTSAYPTAAEQMRLFDRLGERLREMPDVVDATVGTAFPGTFFNETREVLPSGQVPGEQNSPTVSYAAVDDHFLAAYGVALREGRFFDNTDSPTSPRVAVVDQKFVDRYGGQRSVLGRQFRVDPRHPDGSTVTVVGVIPALRLESPDQPPSPSVLIPLRQEPFRVATIGVRTRGDALAIAPRLMALMQTVDADTPLYWIRDYSAVIRSMTFGETTIAQSFGVFGAIALMLAGTGLFGVLAYTVGQRSKEIGVRRALGATSLRVAQGVLAGCARQLVIGLCIGLAAGLLMARLLTNALHSIVATNLSVVGLVVVVMLTAAAIACVIPLRRALRVDPMVALRDE